MVLHTPHTQRVVQVVGRQLGRVAVIDELEGGGAQCVSVADGLAGDHRPPAGLGAEALEAVGGGVELARGQGREARGVGVAVGDRPERGGAQVLRGDGLQCGALQQGGDVPAFRTDALHEAAVVGDGRGAAALGGAHGGEPGVQPSVCGQVGVHVGIEYVIVNQCSADVAVVGVVRGHQVRLRPAEVGDHHGVVEVLVDVRDGVGTEVGVEVHEAVAALHAQQLQVVHALVDAFGQHAVVGDVNGGVIRREDVECQVLAEVVVILVTGHHVHVGGVLAHG